MYKRQGQSCADELAREAVGMRRLRMVVALERVGHRLSDAMPGLEATQKTSPVIGHSAAYNPDQFRVDWYVRKKGCYRVLIR